MPDSPQHENLYRCRVKGRTIEIFARVSANTVTYSVSTKLLSTQISNGFNSSRAAYFYFWLLRLRTSTPQISYVLIISGDNTMSAALPLSPFRGCRTDPAAERVGEMALIGEAALERDLSEGYRCPRQKISRLVYPLFDKPAVGRNSHCIRERSNKIASR